MGVSVPTAGYLVSGYAGGIAIGGPLLALATKKFSRKALLLGLVAAFTIGQAACAFAPDFASMLLLRIAVAVAHGAYFGVAMVVAVGLVREDQRGTAVALILSGLTVSNVIGVPAGTAIGNIWGWRATFWVMCAGRGGNACHGSPLPRTTGYRSSPPAWRQRFACWRASRSGPRSLMLMLIGQFGCSPTSARHCWKSPALMKAWCRVLLLNGVGATSASSSAANFPTGS